MLIVIADKIDTIPLLYCAFKFVPFSSFSVVAFIVILEFPYSALSFTLNLNFKNSPDFPATLFVDIYPTLIVPTVSLLIKTVALGIPDEFKIVCPQFWL